MTMTKSTNNPVQGTSRIVQYTRRKQSLTTNNQPRCVKIYILFLYSLLTVVAGHESLVYEGHGVMLKRDKFVALNSNERLISLFVRVTIPKIHHPNTCNYGPFGVSVSNPSAITILHKARFSALIDDTASRLKSEANDLVELFTELKADTYSGSSKKRYAGLLGLGLGAVNLAFTAFTSFELNSHNKKLEKRFESFKKVQDRRYLNLLKTEESLVTLIEQLEHGFNNKMAVLTCLSDEAIALTYAEKLTNSWSKRLSSLFQYIKLGSLSGGLNADIIGVSHLRNILRDHPLLNNTIYSNSLMNFYKTTDVMMLDASVTNDFLFLHYVMKVPIVDASNIFKLYKTFQVALSANKSCTAFDLPFYVYKSNTNDEFYALNTEACDFRGSIAMCYIPIFQQSKGISCLNNVANCLPKPISCNPRTVYDKSGLLIGGVKDVKVVFTNRSVVVIKTTALGTRFLPWGDKAYVQVADVIFESPMRKSSFIAVPYNSSYDQTMIYFLKNNNYTHVDIGSASVAASIQAMIRAETEEHHQTSSVLTWVAISLSSLAVVGGICVAIYIWVPCPFTVVRDEGGWSLHWVWCTNAPNPTLEIGPPLEALGDQEQEGPAEIPEPTAAPTSNSKKKVLRSPLN